MRRHRQPARVGQILGEGVDSIGRFFFFQAEDGIRDRNVTGVQTCALPIWPWAAGASWSPRRRGPGLCAGPAQREARRRVRGDHDAPAAQGLPEPASQPYEAARQEPIGDDAPREHARRQTGLLLRRPDCYVHDHELDDDGRELNEIRYPSMGVRMTRHGYLSSALTITEAVSPR